MYTDRIVALIATGIPFPSGPMLGMHELPNAARDAEFRRQALAIRREEKAKIRKQTERGGILARLRTS